ncbi:GyrI-like domain-containing protein [Telmatobacter sp. DSM 110680]|uniref:GyrI-like domain-containing protein n=1 Tax=Telmatobacter sp. DSM 110680 TaxID=3036704 RepID=A0AAU7DL75_9BACT
MLTMEKLDLKKQWKHLYQPPAGEITVVNVPPLTYLMVDGEGDPNKSKAFEQAVEALYSLSYTLKFSLKKSPRAIDYGVMPLEGLWWADDPGVFMQADKSAWKWTAMILQPEFISRANIDEAFDEVRRKKNPSALDRVRFETLDEGECVQTLYLGPFSEEGPIIQRMHDAIHATGKNIYGKHHEIYLSDPRRTAPAKLRTIIRQPMR